MFGVTSRVHTPNLSFLRPQEVGDDFFKWPSPGLNLFRSCLNQKSSICMVLRQVHVMQGPNLRQKFFKLEKILSLQPQDWSKIDHLRFCSYLAPVIVMVQGSFELNLSRLYLNGAKLALRPSPRPCGLCAAFSLGVRGLWAKAFIFYFYTICVGSLLSTCRRPCGSPRRYWPTCYSRCYPRAAPGA